MEYLEGTLVRGGTSKALFLVEDDIKLFFEKNFICFNKKNVKAILTYLIGAQDKTRVDGIGGTISHALKCAVIRQCNAKTADIEFDFYQVSDNNISSVGTCGNISSAVGIFALSKNMIPKVKVREPLTKIRIYDTNTNSFFEQTIPIYAGQFDSRIGSPYYFKMPEINYGSGLVTTDYKEALGTLNGNILPFREPITYVEVNNLKFPVSVLDAVNLCVFVDESIFNQYQIPIDEDNERFIFYVKSIRGEIAQKLGIIKNSESIDVESPLIPLFSIIKTNNSNNHINILSISLNKFHHTIPGSVAIAVSAGSKIKGTLVHQKITDYDEFINIGHPSGSVQLYVNFTDDDKFLELSLKRNARIITKCYFNVQGEFLESLTNPIINSFGLAKL